MLKVLSDHDQELLDDLTQVRYDDDFVVIEVAQVFWMSSSHPCAVWHPVTILSKGSSDAQILRAKRNTLKRKTFFGFCELCQKRHAKGHMHNSSICQNCASDHLGVVY